MSASSSHLDSTPDRLPRRSVDAPDGTLTPASLGDQRVEAPTLGEQLSAYEERQRILDSQFEEIDPVTAQGVYLVVAMAAGVALAAMVAAGLGGLLWLL